MPTSEKEGYKKCSGVEGSQEVVDTPSSAVPTHSDFRCENLKIQIEIQEKLVESMRAKKNSRNHVLSVIQKVLRTQKDIFEDDNEQEEPILNESNGVSSTTSACTASEMKALEGMKGVSDELLQAMKELDDLASSSEFCSVKSEQNVDQEDKSGVNEANLFDRCSLASQIENMVGEPTETTAVEDEEWSMDYLLGITDADRSAVSMDEKHGRKKRWKKNGKGAASGGIHADPHLPLTSKEQNQDGKGRVLSSPSGFENRKTMELLRALRKREQKKRNILFKALNRFSLFPADTVAASYPSAAAEEAALALDSTCPPEEQNKRDKDMNRLASESSEELPCWLQSELLGQETADEANQPPSHLPHFCSGANSSAEVVQDISYNASSSHLPTSTTTNESHTRISSAFPPLLESSPPCLESNRTSASDEEDVYTSDFEDLISDEEESLEVKGEVKGASTPS